MTDADTIANADQLWQLVHLVQDTIGKNGWLLERKGIGEKNPPLAALRRLADEIDPDYGRV